YRGSGIRVHDPLEGEDHVLGGQLVPVVERHALAQLDLAGRVLDPAELCGKVADQLAIGVVGQEGAVDHELDSTRSRTGRDVRLEVRRVGREPIAQDATTLGCTSSLAR